MNDIAKAKITRALISREKELRENPPNATDLSRALSVEMGCDVSSHTVKSILAGLEIPLRRNLAAQNGRNGLAKQVDSLALEVATLKAKVASLENDRQRELEV